MGCAAERKRVGVRERWEAWAKLRVVWTEKRVGSAEAGEVEVVGEEHYVANGVGGVESASCVCDCGDGVSCDDS